MTIWTLIGTLAFVGKWAVWLVLPTLAFLFGLIYEIVYLVWLHCADRGWPARSAFMSMVVGAVSILGFSRALNNTRDLVGLVLGYGVGSYVTGVWRRASLARGAL